MMQEIKFLHTYTLLLINMYQIKIPYYNRGQRIIEYCHIVEISCVCMRVRARVRAHACVRACMRACGCPVPVVALAFAVAISRKMSGSHK